MKITRNEFRNKMTVAGADIILKGGLSSILLASVLGSESEIKLFTEDEDKVTEIDVDEKEITGAVFSTAAEITVRMEEPFALPILTAIGIKFDKVLNGEEE